VPELVTDASFWEVIDKGRNLASEEDTDRFNFLIRERAQKVLKAAKAKLGGKRRRSSQQEEGSDDEEDGKRTIRTGLVHVMMEAVRTTTPRIHPNAAAVLQPLRDSCPTASLGPLSHCLFGTLVPL
jgi:hypothetical protein